MKLLGHVKDSYYPFNGIDYERSTVRCIVKNKDNKVAVLYILNMIICFLYNTLSF